MKEVDKNTDEYRLFIKYSKEIGMDPSMVQAAGGNTSLKQGNTMWVKASGKWLLDAQSNELMVPMSVSKIKETLEKIALQNFNFIETNSFTRLKNNFNEDYNKIKMDSLSKREIQVLKLFIKGEKNFQISNKLKINQKNC